MSGRGPAPKDPAERVRRNKPDMPPVTVVPDSEIRGPELPDGLDWPAATLDWWETWRRSPMAQTFVETDWSALIDTAVLHAQFWSGDLSVAAELRLRSAKFGATPEDRLRLKLSIGKPDAKPQPKAQTAGSKDRRSRLLRAVGDD